MRNRLILQHLVGHFQQAGLPFNKAQGVEEDASLASLFSRIAATI